MIAPSLLLAALAGALAVAAWIRTPDRDRPRIYPRNPELWAGITGEPAPLRDALGTVLFWAVAACGLGLGTALVSLFAPGEMGVAVAVGTVVGAVLAVEAARRMLPCRSGGNEGVATPTQDARRPRAACALRRRVAQPDRADAPRNRPRASPRWRPGSPRTTRTRSSTWY